MKRKMTFVARGVKCGCFAASGEAGVVKAAATDSRASKLCNAMAPSPRPDRTRKSRREDDGS